MKRVMIALALTLLTGCVVAPVNPPLPAVVVYNPPPPVSDAYHSPPPILFQAPPVLIVIPDTNNVYVVPDINADLFFWNGSWWRFNKGFWYRSQYYDRGWVYYNKVPSFYYDVDPGWRGYYKNKNWYGHRWNYERIPNQQLQKNWKNWQDNRYWESKKRWGVQSYQPRTQQQQQELRHQREEQYKKMPQGQPSKGQPPQRSPQVGEPKKPPQGQSTQGQPLQKTPNDQPSQGQTSQNQPPKIGEPKKPLQDQQPKEHQPQPTQLEERPGGERQDIKNR